MTSTGTVTGVEEDSIDLLHAETDAEITVDVDSDTGAITSFRGNNKRIPVDRGRGNDVQMPEVLPYYFDTDRNGYVLWQGIVKPNGETDIPANFRRKPVVAIGGGAFYGNKSLRSIKIPAGITSIGDHVFVYCENLETVTFETGSKLENISHSAFMDCTSLSAITIPAGVTFIGSGAFWGCENLKTVTFEAGSKLENIDFFTFTNCKSLTGIEIPANVMSIGTINPDGGPMGAFEGCENLKIVTFESGSKLETIGSFAFADCISLTSIEIPASVTSIGGCAFSSRFFDHHLYSLKTVTFAPNSRLKDIGVRTFEYTGLTSIIIPANVTSIGSGAFSFCADLETVTFEAGSKLETIGYMAFFDCNSISAITIPAGVTSIGDHAFSSCESLSSAIAIPSGVTSINNSSFSGTRISAITIPSGVTSIGDYAFLECIDLKTVTFETGSKLETIGDKAFRRCTSISAITIPAGVTSIGKSAFDSWTASQTINIPFANQAAADAAWGEGWRNICFATINYNG